MPRRYRRDHPSTLVVTAVLAVLAAATLVLLLSQKSSPITQPEYEKYNWQDTKYRGIRTKISRKQGPTYTSTIEYPITKSADVNQIIADTVESFDLGFQEAIADRLPVRGGHFEQNTSYQVIRFHDSFLSIEVVTSRDTGGATIDHETAFWTFNLDTGRVVALSDIFGGKGSDGEARLLLYIKQDLERQAAKREIPLDHVAIAENVNSDTLTSFLAPDAGTIRFDFGQGTVAPAVDGPVTVSLSIANLQLFLQSDEARRIFDIMPIDTAPEWQAPQVTKGAVDCTRAKCIALTFDDGPGAHTARLLDILKESHAHASFFVIGKNAAAHPELVKRMQAEGHTVGNHTWSHKSLPLLSPGNIDTELSQTNNAIENILGTKPTYMRPPNGAISPNVFQALLRANMTGVMWSVDTRDWADRSADIVYSRVVSGAKPGAIIILHDIHKTSVDAVPRILKALQRQGYALVSIDELFGPNAAPGKIINHSN